MPRVEAGPLRARNRASIRVLVFIARGSGAQAPHGELIGSSVLPRKGLFDRRDKTRTGIPTAASIAERMIGLGEDPVEWNEVQQVRSTD